MKIGIISDIHGHLDALEKVLACLNDTEAIFNLGDVANFTPDVNKCYDLLKNKKIINFWGNHEFEAISAKIETENVDIKNNCFGPDFGVSPENKAFIRKNFKKDARLNLNGLLCYFSHGVITKYNNFIFFEYLDNENISALVQEQNVSVVFCGHIHIAQLIEYDPLNHSTLKEMETGFSIKFKLLFDSRRFIFRVLSKYP